MNDTTPRARPVRADRVPKRGALHRTVACAILAVASGVFAISAPAQERHGPPGLHGPGRPGGAGPMMLFGGPPEHMARGIDRMLDGLGASDAQRSQIKQIAMSAATDLRTQRDAGQALRARGAQIFAAPTVDTAAAESVRQQISARYDQASRRMLQAMLDIAKVLTPEQRATFARRLADREATMRERMQRMPPMQPPSAPTR